jgi:PAS domain S-box-containing protein
MSKVIAASSVEGRHAHQDWQLVSRGADSAVVATLSLCAAFAVCAYISLQLHFPSSLVYFIWLPSVAVLVALLLSPPRLWWVYLIALFPIHMLVELWTVAAPPLSIALFYLPIWIQALAGALVVGYLAPRPFRFHDLRTLIAFLLGAAAAAFVQALMLTAILVLTAPASNFALTFAQGFLENALAVLAFAPALILVSSAAYAIWRSAPWGTGASAWSTYTRAALHTHIGQTSRSRLAEAGLLVLGLLGVGVVAFGGYLSLPSTLPALLYAVLPLLLWASVRFGLGGTSLALCGLTLLAIQFAIHGRGPFSARSVTEDLISLQLFFIAVSMPLLVLAVIIEERKRAQEGLRQSEERYRAVVSNFPHGAVLLYGPDLRHLFADGQGLPQVGLSKSSVEGRTLWEAFPSDMAAALEAPYRAGLAGTPAALELVHRGRTYQTQVLPILDSATQTGMVVMQDVTDQRRADVLAELDRAKTAFFSNISHEFRTPLTLLLGPTADALADREEPLPSRQRERLELIQRNGMRLHKLVNAFLDFARIEGGRVQASYTLTDLATFTSDLTSTFRSAIERAGLDLVVQCDPQPQWAYVDRDMWEKIVLNLLSNALKFTFNGQISVTQVSVDDEVELQIRDTGTGIPADELPRVFERFHRVQQARARTHEGTGIGLAMVQELTRLHGGSVRVDSVLGQGSTFTVTIPSGAAQVRPEASDEASLAAPSVLGAEPFVEEAQQWARSAAEEAEILPWLDATTRRPADTSGHDIPRPSGQAMPDSIGPHAKPDLANARILVVDDNPDMRDYLARLLEVYWKVETAPSGASALARARERAPDLVVADVMMPGVDGFALLRALRQEPSTTACPVVLLSARAGEEAIVEGLEAGGDDYLVKPFAATELVARVRTHLELAYLRRQAVLHAGQLEAIIQAMTEAVFVFNAGGDMVQTNVAGHALLGIVEEDKQRAPALNEHASLLPLLDPQAGVASPAQMPIKRLLSGEVFAAGNALDLLVKTHDGHEHTLQVTGSPVRDALGVITAAVVVCRDITELKRTQDDLVRQERLYRTLVEHQPDLISRFDRHHQRIYTNSQVATILGGSPQEVIGTTYRDFGFPDEVAAAWDRMLTQVFTSGQPLAYETDAPLPTGTRTFQVRLAPELASDGSVESVLGTATDITDRKQIELDLRHAKGVAEMARSEAEVAKRQEEQRREEAERRRRAAEGLRDVMAILNSEHALDDVLDYVAQQAANLLESPTAAIYRAPATGAGVTLLSTYGMSPDQTLATFVPVRSRRLRHLVQTHSAIAVSDTSRLPQGLSPGGDHGDSAAAFVVPVAQPFRSVLAGPIVVGGEPYGGLAVYYHEPRLFAAEECAVVGVLCDQVALAIENANLRVQASRASALAERTRLARELHDAVTQTLFSASLVASSLPRVWEVDRAAGEQGLDNLRLLTRTALAEMRSLLVELRPAALTEKPLGELLQQLGEAMASRVQTAIDIDVRPGAEGPLPSEVQIAFYRIAQEALNNITKYARARSAHVQLRRNGAQTILRVHDDGIGFDVAQPAQSTIRAHSPTGGMDADRPTTPSTGDQRETLVVGGSGHSGIAIMRERARNVGASYVLRSRPGRGTLLVVRWPIINGEDEDVDEENNRASTGSARSLGRMKHGTL